jgi:hypothetical protein
MRGMRVLPLVLAFTLLPAVAFADVDCPVGTQKKTEGPNEWCEPVVCVTDAQCGADVCKPVPLCIEIGTVKNADGKDAGQRLMARQRCGPDRSCPSSTTCLDGNRCISKTEADKMGLLAQAAPSASSASAPAASDKKCGCSVVGAPSPAFGALACAALGAIAIVARRRPGASTKRRKP